MQLPYSSVYPEGIWACGLDVAPGTVTYGLKFQAWCVFLMVMHHIPVKRCADILESMSGTRSSERVGACPASPCRESGRGGELSAPALIIFACDGSATTWTGVRIVRRPGRGDRRAGAVTAMKTGSMQGRRAGKRLKPPGQALVMECEQATALRRCHGTKVRQAADIFRRWRARYPAIGLFGRQQGQPLAFGQVPRRRDKQVVPVKGCDFAQVEPFCQRHDARIHDLQPQRRVSRQQLGHAPVVMRGGLDDPQFVGSDRSAELGCQFGPAPPLRVSQQVSDLGHRQ